jgi:hypothetical protein
MFLLADVLVCSTEEFSLFYSTPRGSNSHDGASTERSATDSPESSGIYLVDNKNLHTYPQLSSHVLELKTKPKALKIKLRDETTETVLITGATLVSSVLEEMGHKMGIDDAHLRDYGLYMAGSPSTSAVQTLTSSSLGASITSSGKQDGVWLDASKPLSSYELQDGVCLLHLCTCLLVSLPYPCSL